MTVNDSVGFTRGLPPQLHQQSQGALEEVLLTLRGPPVFL